MPYLERTLEAVLKDDLRRFPAVLLTGPRQSGKTTLLKRVGGRRFGYASLDEPAVLELARRDPNSFFERHSAPLILDEIQYAPELLRSLKARIDLDRRPGRWLLTGSQQFPLMQGVSESLAGRVAVRNLLPLSPSEAAGRARLKPSVQDLLDGLQNSAPGAGSGKSVDLEAWILRGGFPQLWADRKLPVSSWAGAYITTYLERDLRSLRAIGDLNAFSTFLNLCAARTGQILNLSDLARDAGVSMPTAKAWLSVLEAGHQVFLLPSYHQNLGKRLVKAPKLYLGDTAVACYLCHLRDPKAALAGPMAGALLETAVVGAWLKAFVHRGERPSLYYWRSSDGLEVDLLADWNGTLYPMEIKLNATPRPGFADSMRKWATLQKGKTAKGVVFCPIKQVELLGHGAKAVPWDWV